MERKTKQRTIIIEIFKDANRPLGPSEVFSLAQQSLPQLGFSTVYRAIHNFVEDGLLVAVDLPGEAPRYEIAGKDHHHHFLCRQCDGLYEVESCTADVHIGAPQGFITERHDIILHGVCSTCTPA